MSDAEFDEHDLVGAYALDAVDDLERRRFETHLASCAACRRELAELRRTVASLSVGLAAEPRASMRSTVLDAVAREGRPAASSTKPAAPSVRTTVRRRTLLGAAAAVVIGGGTVGVWRATRPDAAPVAADILSDPAATRRQTTFDGSRVTLARTSDGHAAVRFDPAPKAVDGRRYTIWADGADGSLRNAGELPSGPDASLVLGTGGTDLRGIAVTLEDEGRHPSKPTMAPLFGLPLHA